MFGPQISQDYKQTIHQQHTVILENNTPIHPMTPAQKA
jgi:hypothetical protein